MNLFETVIESWAVKRFLVESRAKRKLLSELSVEWEEQSPPPGITLTHLNLPANFFKMSGTIFVLRVVGF